MTLVSIHTSNLRPYGAFGKPMPPASPSCSLESPLASPTVDGKRPTRNIVFQGNPNAATTTAAAASSPVEPASPMVRRGCGRFQAPDCKRVDSGFYSGMTPSVATPPPRSSSISAQNVADTPTPANVVINSIPMPQSYKMTVVTSFPSHTYGQSAPELSVPSPQSISEREFATNPLHPRFLAKYAVQGELGFGATGFVVAARRLEDGKAVAVKFMFKDRIPVTNWLRDRQLGTVPLEIFILKRLNHEHIVRFLDFYEDKKFFYLVMETHGVPWIDFRDENTPPLSASNLRMRRPSRRASQDLFECIEQNPYMEEHDVKHIFKQIASAVAYLHQNNIVHRDIKDENIVIDANKNVKLIDFGNAQFIPRSERDYFDRFYGTMHCAAPEILRGEKYRGPEQDVWCLGVLLYTLAFSQTPFRDAASISTGKYTKPRFRRSELLMDLLGRVLDPDVKTRFSVAEVLRHPWLCGEETVVTVA